MHSEGYIKLHRALLQWEWYTAPNHVHLFIHLLLRANYTAGRWRGVDYERGDVLTSLSSLSAETGMSVRNVRTVLRNLESTGEVTREATSQLTKLTICNYASYQSSLAIADKEPTQSRHGADNSIIKKERKEGKEEEGNRPAPIAIDGLIHEFIALLPLDMQGGKGIVARNLRRLHVDEQDIPAIIEAMRRQMEIRQSAEQDQRKYFGRLEKWFNDECWNDPDEAVRAKMNMQDSDDETWVPQTNAAGNMIDEEGNEL